MIRFFQNLSIGTKLGLTSGLGVVFVALMIANQLMGSSAVNLSHQSTLDQAGTARAAIDAKAAARGLQTGALNIRVANGDAELETAKEYLADRSKAFVGFADEISRLSSLTETRTEVDS